MTELAANLWELLGLTKRKSREPGRPPTPPAPPTPMRRRYDALVTEMKQAYGVRVRKWRTSSTGCAWVVRYADSTESKLIEAPYPKGPVSCGIFLHEIGHHAIGFNTHRLRCLEEYDAWRWALETMRARGFNVTRALENRMTESVRYAIQKARRRGLKTLPPELATYA